MGDLERATRYCTDALALSSALHFTNGQIRSAYLLGVIAFQKGEAGRALPLIKKALASSQAIGNSLLEAEGWYYLGEVYDRSDKSLPEKIRCYQQSRKGYRQLGDRAKEAYLLKCIADMHLLQIKYAQAYSELQQVLALYRSVGYQKLHYTYDLLATVNRYLGNYPQAIRYGLLSVERAQATGDTAYLAYFYGRLAILHEELNQWEAGLQFRYKSLVLLQQQKNVFMISHMIPRISHNLLHQGRAQEALSFYQKNRKKYPPKDPEMTLRAAGVLAACHLALKQYSLAEKQYRQIIAAEDTLNDNGSRKINHYQQAGNFYLVSKQYDKARRYLSHALDLSATGGTLREVMNIHMLFFKIDSAQGNYKQAIAHHQRYKALNDSIFSEVQSKQIANLQIQYKIKEKEQNIALLTQQNEVQKANLAQKDFQQQVMIAGGALLLLLLGLGYNRYRLKQRSNQLLEAKQREINEKNHRLQQVIGEKEELLVEKDSLLAEMGGLITHQNHILQEKDGLLQEKQWLLKEIHHRVKNNLQIVMSLLSSQAAYLQDDKAQLAIRESQNRIYAISLSHQKLYLSEKIALIDMAAYIREITEYLQDSFQMPGRIRFALAVAPVELDGAVAVPLGLIINEAVTNALKYAFPHGRTGQVSITLSRVDQQNCLLTIRDDGVGLNDVIDLTRTRSLGMGLMRGLSKQLGGSLTVETVGGVQIRVLFNSVPQGISLKKSA